MGKKMIYNNPSYLCFKNRKPNIEILHNIYNMYKIYEELERYPSFHWYEMIRIPGGGILVRKNMRREEKDIMNLFKLIRNR